MVEKEFKKNLLDMYLNEVNKRKKIRIEDRINRLKEEQENIRKVEESIFIERKNQLEKKIKFTNQFWEEYHRKHGKINHSNYNQTKNALSNSLPNPIKQQFNNYQESRNHQQDNFRNILNDSNQSPLSLNRIDYSFKTPRYIFDENKERNNQNFNQKFLTQEADIINYKKQNLHFGKRIFFDKIFNNVNFFT